MTRNDKNPSNPGNPSGSSRRLPACAESDFEDANSSPSEPSHTLTDALEKIASLIRQRDLLAQMLGDALRECARLDRALKIAKGEFEPGSGETQFLDRR